MGRRVTYGVVIRDGLDRRLFLRVRRSLRGDVYVAWAVAPGELWDPHTSYHASGRFHHKSYGRLLVRPRCRPGPDETMTATEQVIGTPISRKATRRLPLAESARDISAAFEIDADELDPVTHTVGVAIDLVPSGCVPVPVPGGRLIRRQVFEDGSPAIVLSLWDMRGEAYGVTGSAAGSLP